MHLSKILLKAERNDTRRRLLLEERQPCLKIKITLAIFKLSRNMPFLNYEIDNICQWAICYRCSRRPSDFLVSILSSNDRTSTSFTLVKRNDFFFSVHITRGKVICSEKFRCKFS